MKKIVLPLLAGLATLSLASCSSKPELIILNWQDYLSHDLVTQFEQEYNCTVNERTLTSNELMYNDILNRRVAYDIAIPSDYMIHKLQKEGLIQEIDYSLLENYEMGIFVDELQTLMDSEGCSEYKDYYVPYFWGSLGIMYSTKNYPNLGEIVETNGWKVFFEDGILPEGAKVAMYDSSRDAFAAAELYLGYSLNSTDEAILNECADLLVNRNFTIWGTDNLKMDVAAGNVDVALVYSGDFFDAYYADTETESGNEETYGIYAPTNANNVFFDAMVIPTTSTQTDLAYKFIDFMLDHDNSYTNADAVGYCPTLQSVYDEIFADPEWDYVTEILAYNPSLVVSAAGSKAEVYLDLGDAYSTMDDLFNNKIRIN